jgi:sirohydrochlorin cobaltochelatase
LTCFLRLLSLVDVSMPPVVADRAVLLMAHGSRDLEARAEYRRIHAALAGRLAPTTVVFSVLEFPGEDGLVSIHDGWKACLAAGASHIVGVPFFLFPAGHVRGDLPSEISAARDAGGWATVDLLPPLGAADEVLQAVIARVDEAARSMPGGADTALILVGAGTSDPDANGDLCKAARLLWERSNDRFGLVEAAWVSLTRPTVGEMIERCVRLGAQRIAIVPYFLNTGVLLRRIDERVEEARRAYPGLSIVRASHLGLFPSVLDLIERRARQAIQGGDARSELLTACGRPSCVSVVRGRSDLRAPGVPPTTIA